MADLTQTVGLSPPAPAAPRVLVAAAILVAGVLLGYAGLFFGGTFLVDEDPVTAMTWTSRNALTDGWRADLGLGLPFFVADPGAGHVWAIYSLLERFFDRSPHVYTGSIVVLLIGVAIAQYVFLRRHTAELGIWLLPLSLMIVFSPLQQEFFFLRTQITLALAAPLILVLLDEYLLRPAAHHILAMGFLVTAVFVFGSLSSAMHISAATFPFAALVVWRRRVLLGPALRRFAVLWAVVIPMMLLLMAWTFYSMFHERMLNPYERDVAYAYPLLVWNSLSDWILFVSKYLHAGWLPREAFVHGLSELQPITWNNVSPVFPLVLLIMSFRRSENFWEFACKTMIWIIFIWGLLCFVTPGLSFGLVQRVISGYPLTKFHPFMQVLQVALIAFMLVRFQKGEGVNVEGSSAAALRRVLGGGLLIFYGSLTVFSAALNLAHSSTRELVTHAMKTLVDGRIPGDKAEIAVMMAGSNTDLLAETWGLSAVLFYGSSAALVMLFLVPKWLAAISRRHAGILPVLLLGNSLLMSWTLFPLAYATPVWDSLRADAKAAPLIQPTDRMYRAEVKSPERRTPEYYRKKYVEGPFGPRRYRTGYRDSPALDMSVVKSLTQQHIAEFIRSLLARDGYRIDRIRALDAGRLLESSLFDVAAVKFFYSDHPLTPVEYLDPVYSAPDFFLYRYKRGWPWAYLANGVATIQNPDDMSGKAFGPAYIFADSGKALPKDIGGDRSAHLALKSFRLDRFTFDYRSVSSNLLVVADAWHPYWQVNFNDKPVSVIKANGVFKAAVLPPGNGLVEFYFYTAPYRPGIWISAVAFIVFGGAWWWLWRRKQPCRQASP